MSQDEHTLSNWNQFVKRVRELTKLSVPRTATFCSFLKKQKEISAWSESEIMTALSEWSDADPTAPEKEKEKEKPKKEKEKEKAPKVLPPTLTPPPTQSIHDLEYALSEARKQLSIASATADKDDVEAKKAASKADAAMKTAIDLKQKAEQALADATKSRKLTESCQSAVDLCASQLEAAHEQEKDAAREREKEKEKEKKAKKEKEKEKAAKPEYDTCGFVTVASATSSASASASVDTAEPLHDKRKNIPKHVKTLVWNKYIGSDVAQADCVSCRSEKISIRNFHCGHVVSEAAGGDVTINNLRPICAACNLSMGTKSMNEFTREFFGWTV
jgi:hypothetical protein